MDVLAPAGRRSVWLLLLTALFYFAMAKLGLALAFTHGSVSPTWPATGVAIAALVHFGGRVWPAVFLGAFLANVVLTGEGVLASTGIALGNVLEALAVAYLVRRFIGEGMFESPAKNIRFIFAVLIACLISATIGTLTLCSLGSASWANYGVLWFTWWLGDASGGLVMAPWLLTLGHTMSLHWDRRRLAEAAALGMGLTLCSLVVFCDLGFQPVPQNYPFAYFVLPFLVWAGLRFGQPGVTTLTLILCGIATFGTVSGHGPFIGVDQNHSLLAIQLFICITAITTQILAAVVCELKLSQSEARNSIALLDTLFRTAPVGLGYIDKNLRYVRINSTLAAFNRRSPEEHIGRTLQEIMPAIANKTVPIYRKVLETGEALVNQEISAVTLPGRSARHWLASYYPVRVRNEVAGIGIIVIDFTDRKYAEEDLKELASNLAHSNRELEQFAYVASHDLQEPLRMVSNYMGLVATRYRDKLDADGRKYVDFAVEGSRRMRELVLGLLEYCRIGQSAHESATVELSKVIEDVKQDLKMALEESQAKLDVSELPAIQGNELLLRQLFQNLLANALKFRKPGEVSIAVDCKREGKDWLISVKDSGVGFDMAHAERLFLLFHRLHSRVEYPGTGIGLALCKKIVGRHGGRIWAESQPGQGSTFSFTLPS